MNTNKKNNRKVMNRKSGFTLVEIMSVVALIAILFVIFVPRLDFANNKVRESGLQSDFRSYQLAFEQVARQNSGFQSFAKTSTPDADANKALAKALNSYLDKKLQVQVADDAAVTAGKATAVGDLYLEIEDPWKVPYIFAWDYAKDAVYVFSAGADKLTNGTTAEDLLKTSETEGEADTVNNDNYSLSVSYTVEGLSITTTGFDNNIDR